MPVPWLRKMSFVAGFKKRFPDEYRRLLKWTDSDSPLPFRRVGYLSVYETADFLKCSDTTVRRWVKSGKISCERAIEAKGSPLLFPVTEVERVAGFKIEWNPRKKRYTRRIATHTPKK